MLSLKKNVKTTTTSNIIENFHESYQILLNASVFLFIYLFLIVFQTINMKLLFLCYVDDTLI